MIAKIDKLSNNKYGWIFVGNAEETSYYMAGYVKPLTKYWKVIHHSIFKNSKNTVQTDSTDAFINYNP